MIAKFEGLEARRYEDIKAIVAPEIGPKSFGTFEKLAPGLNFSDLSLAKLRRSLTLKLLSIMQQRNS